MCRSLGLFRCLMLWEKGGKPASKHASLPSRNSEEQPPLRGAWEKLYLELADGLLYAVAVFDAVEGDGVPLRSRNPLNTRRRICPNR